MACFGCVCLTCANNVELLHSTPGEADEPCFNCDSCQMYIGPVTGAHFNLRKDCAKHKICEYEVQRRRRSIRVVRRV